MLYTINGKMHSTLSGAELLALTNTDPCTIALETDKQILNLFEEMFGEENN